MTCFILASIFEEQVIVVIWFPAVGSYILQKSTIIDISFFIHYYDI